VGAWFLLDVRDGMERAYYYCGVHDFINPAVIDAILAPGGTYVDIGANIGIHTLRAARRVQPHGRVYAFEANPETAARLRAHVSINRLANVTVFDVALSDHVGRGVLKPGLEPHAGTFTLEPHGRGARGHEISTARGDDVLSRIRPRGRVLVKIDVEGHEFHVLRGLHGWLSANRPVVMMEFTPQWLRCSGTDPGEVAAFFTALGYTGYRPVMRRGMRGACFFQFTPFVSPEGAQEDIVWMPAGEAPLPEIVFDPASRKSVPCVSEPPLPEEPAEAMAERNV